MHYCPSLGDLPVSRLIDLPSFIFVASSLIAGLILSLPDLKRGLLAARDLSLPMGLLASIIGLVALFAHMDDPSEIGPALGVALLPVLYGVAFYPLLSCFSMLCPTRGDAESIPSWSRGYVALLIVGAVIVAGILTHGPLPESLNIFIDGTAILCLSLLTVAPALLGTINHAAENRKATHLLALRDYSAVTAIVGTFIGAIGILYDMQAPEAIGPSLATGVFSLFYAILVFTAATLLYRAETGEPAPQNFSHQGFYLFMTITYLFGSTATIISLVG